MLRGSLHPGRPLLWVVLGLLITSCGQFAPAATGAADPVGADPEVVSRSVTDTASRSAVGAAVREPATRPHPPAARVSVDPGWAPFAAVAGIELVLPSAGVEMIGFHEANHQGAQQLEVLPPAVPAMTLDSRDRGTGSRTAVDVVVDPALEIRAPVSGVVVRAGTYVLYCDHADDYVVIAPDTQPAWEVRLLHIDGVQVSAGDRVEAGVTVLAPRPTPLPFASQIDEHTAEPSWPHVHIEVVDPSIPRGGSGSDC